MRVAAISHSMTCLRISAGFRVVPNAEALASATASAGLPDPANGILRPRHGRRTAAEAAGHDRPKRVITSRNAGSGDALRGCGRRLSCPPRSPDVGHRPRWMRPHAATLRLGGHRAAGPRAHALDTDRRSGRAEYLAGRLRAPHQGRKTPLAARKAAMSTCFRAHCEVSIRPCRPPPRQLTDATQGQPDRARRAPAELSRALRRPLCGQYGQGAQAAFQHDQRAVPNWSPPLPHGEIDPSTSSAFGFRTPTLPPPAGRAATRVADTPAAISISSRAPYGAHRRLDDRE